MQIIVIVQRTPIITPGVLFIGLFLLNTTISFPSTPDESEGDITSKPSKQSALCVYSLKSIRRLLEHFTPETAVRTATCKLRTAHCSLWASYCLLHTAHCKLYIVHCTLYNLTGTRHTPQCTLQTFNTHLLQEVHE